MKTRRETDRRLRLEALERRFCLASSMGWDGPVLGRTELSYYVAPVPASLELSEQQVEAGLETALGAWAGVADIAFRPTDSPGLHNSIDFTFERLDGPGGTLAQAYYPDDVNGEPIAGNVVFDTAEGWEVGNARGGAALDLVYVAVHEIGHSLGLEHSEAVDSVMRPTISPHQAFTGLGRSDADAILDLYAPAPAPVPLVTSIRVDRAVISENEQVTLSGSYLNFDSDGGHVVTVDWGDGSPETLPAIDKTDGDFQAVHRFSDDPDERDSNEYTITVRVEDADSRIVDSATTAVTVENAKPRLKGLAVAPIEEGAIATLTGAIDDPGGRDAFTVVIDWGDGSDAEAYTYPAGTTDFRETHRYADDPGGTTGDDYTVMVTVIDDDLGSFIGLTTATVLNAAPTVSIVDPPSTGWLGGGIHLAANVVDAGAEDLQSTQWTVTHNGLPYATGRGLDFSFTPTTEGTYEIRVSASDGDGGTATDTASVRVEGNLGTVDFLTLDGLSLSGDRLDLVFETAHAAILTVETVGIGDTEAVSLQLYDRSSGVGDAGNPIAQSPSRFGEQRIDHAASVRDQYRVRLEGASSDFGLRITNLVRREGGTVRVYGSDGDDDFRFDASAGRRIRINGTAYEFTETEAALVDFDGGAGRDKAILDDSPGDERLEAGPATATLRNSPADSQPDFTVHLAGFEELHVYARSDGDDRAALYDSEGNDKFKAEPEERYAKMYGGAMYNRVKFFDGIDAFSSGQRDLARLFGTGGNDVFEGEKALSRLVGAGFDVRAHGFRRAIAYASEGTDAATFVDSTLKDEFHAKPWKLELFDAATDGDVYRITARGFDSATADASSAAGIDAAGGSDIAKIWPSSADDLIETGGDRFRFLRAGSSTELLYEVVGFETVRVRETLEESDAAAIHEPLAYDLILAAGWD